MNLPCTFNIKGIFTHISLFKSSAFEFSSFCNLFLFLPSSFSDSFFYRLLYRSMLQIVMSSTSGYLYASVSFGDRFHRHRSSNVLMTKHLSVRDCHVTDLQLFKCYGILRRWVSEDTYVETSSEEGLPCHWSLDIYAETSSGEGLLCYRSPGI